MTKPRQNSLFEGERSTLKSSIQLSLASLNEYGKRYRHWSMAYSGGKDSSAAVTFVAYALREGLIETPPESLTVLYADTRQELPPLQKTAMALMEKLEGMGINTKVVLPEMDKRFYVYMLGRGVPPPKNRFRWCTGQLKVNPMMAALEQLRRESGQKILSLTGVRLGESAVRDNRIAVSCSKDSGECGQGWFQVATSDAIADTLAPIVHWRLCQVYDWLYFEQGRHGFPEVSGIADVYGDEDVRTGCMGCNLASKDVALERLIERPNWGHLRPLMELRPLFAELTKPRSRIRKAEPERLKAGGYAQNGQRMGPIKLEVRERALEQVLDIQARARVDLINPEEEARIRHLISIGQWPDGWSGMEPSADKWLDDIRVVGEELITQPIFADFMPL
jgi:DNA sulfur modification protein DndC